MHDYKQALDAGWYIFPLHPIGEDGACACGHPSCESPGKHPRMSNWQHVRHWDGEQLAYMQGLTDISEENQFLPGYGINLTGSTLLVVDVDARNGGVESLEDLNMDLRLNLEDEAGFVVRTGSGGGSMHIYMRIPEDWRRSALVTHLEGYPGIDFKSTGFVVGSGSLHASGARYATIKGSPAEVEDAPVELLGLLKRSEAVRTSQGGSATDVTIEDLTAIVMGIKNPGRDYERWIRIGMGIHHATDGAKEGYQLWVRWSAQSPMHDEATMPMKWGSFGKYSYDQVTVATLVAWAQADGWIRPVTFTEAPQDIPAPPPSSITGREARMSYDLKRPPGLVGKIVDWINSRSMYPRENLAVAAAITAVANVAGLRYRVAGFNTTLNLIVFGVADSGSGKGSILNSLQEIHRAVGIAPATHGNIKSEQELIRNQIMHQAALYVVDEAGSLLGKISNAKRSGRTAYLEHVVGTLMALYSAATGYFGITGDMKGQIREQVERDVAALVRRMDNGEQGLEVELSDLRARLLEVDSGIPEPYTSFFGVSEPGSFNDVLNSDLWLLTGGFIGRSLIFTESDGVPHRKPVGEFGDHKLPDPIKMQLMALYGGGYAGSRRVARQGPVVHIPMSSDAQAAEHDIYSYWHELAKNEQDAGSGLHPIATRAPELTLKVAGILGVGGGAITLEHMGWAHALVHKITHEKIARAKAQIGSDSADKSDRREGLIEAVKSVMIQQDEFTSGVVANRFRGRYDKESVCAAIEYLVEIGWLTKEERTAKNGRTYEYYSVKTP